MDEVVAACLAQGVRCVALIPLVGCFLSAQVSAGTTTYSYDALGRLIEVTLPTNGVQSITEFQYDAAGNRTSLSNTHVDTTPPLLPTSLSATAQAHNWVRLTWTASLDVGGGPVSQYKIYRGGGYIGVVSASPYDDHSVVGNTPYSYKISAVDPAGNESAQTAAVSVTTPPAPDVIAPSVPSSLQAIAVTGTRINLSWGGSTDTGGSGLAGYEIFRNGGGSPIATSSVASFADQSLQPGTTYSYTVRAYDGAGNRSGMSNQASATTLDTIAPSIPTTLQAVAASGTSINLSWGASSDTGGSGLAGYEIFRNGGGTPIATATTTSFTDQPLQSATAYSYTVRAYDHAGNRSALSNSATATTLDTVAPSAPGAISISGLTSYSATASWGAATDNVGVTGYRYSWNGGAPWTNVSGLSVFLGNLSPGSTYGIFVQARDAAGNWGPSTSKFFTTPSDGGGH